MDPIPLPLPILMDGATGTQLQQRGMPAEACTETWALEHPDVLLELQRAYVDAGSQVLLAPTFGANRAALARRGIEGQTEEYNRRLVKLTQTAAAGKALVAADLAPTGLLLPPFGETSFDELVDVYAQQARACQEAGVDLFVLETTVTMAEARAAVLAVKSVSDKPIWASCTCDEDGRTPFGADVLAIMIVLQGMGVSAFGLNCSTGPEDMARQLRRLVPYASLPLIAKPSAGLPDRTDGKPVYRCPPAEFASRAEELSAAGARIFGGCCGTGPEHIAALRQALERAELSSLPVPERDPDVIPCASEKEARFITPDIDVGEPIACTPDLLEDILEAEASPQGALKIAILEQDDLDIFAENQYAIQDALCLYSDVPELLEGALRAYQGRAFWDGTGELEPEFLNEMARKYGLILL